MTTPAFDPWSDVLVAEISGQKIRAPQYGLRGEPRTREEWTKLREPHEVVMVAGGQNTGLWF